MDEPRSPSNPLPVRDSTDLPRRRGKLKIFFGAAPGVGKTYSMLEAGRKLAKEGVDVLVGYVEPHARPETQALVLGLDVLARLETSHRGVKLLEFDLDAALQRRPQLILVDELAHTNAPGLTHAKRWQDVAQLLDAGIDVYTTLNVQHLESLNDVVAQITGITVRETVPDTIFEEADEVEAVDLAPDNLLERLREGKIYIPQQAQRAIQNFFSKGNLIALRELALRKAAERVGAQMEDYRQRQGVVGTWPARDRLLVCVGPSPFAARLVRAARRMASGLKAPWIAVHIETPADAGMPDTDRSRLAETFRLAEELGGETVVLTGDRLAEELLHYARSRNVTKIIVGKPQQPWWREWLSGSLVYELTRKSGDIDIYAISGDPTPAPPAIARPRAAPIAWTGYLWAVLIVLLLTLVGALLSRHIDATNLIMFYLLGVSAVALRFGRGPSILASVLSVAFFDFFFIPPHLTFAVEDTQYVFTFLVMLLTGILISTLTARVKFQAESARQRERRTASLYALSQELAATQGRDQLARVAARHAADAIAAPAVVLLPDHQHQLVPLGADVGGFDPDANEMAVAQWVLDHGQPAGRGTTTLPGAAGFYLPLGASHGTVGVLGIALADDHAPMPHEQFHLLETFARLIALAIQRAELVAEAERIRIQMETEQLRSSLLSAVSHDLRTPLSVITGASSTLLQQETSLPLEARRELLASVLDEAERLNRLVANLLDMTRLEAGALQLRKEWQSFEEIVGTALARLCRALRNHPVITSLADDLPFVPIDGLLVEQVLVNLLENAAKYAPPNSPIELRAQADSLQLIVDVADSGPGIPPDDLQRIFEKFYRAPATRSRPGAGLGLAICHGIVQLHGGTISAQNRPGGGAVFRFTLPIAGSPPPANVPHDDRCAEKEPS